MQVCGEGAILYLAIYFSGSSCYTFRPGGRTIIIMPPPHPPPIMIRGVHSSSVSIRLKHLVLSCAVRP